MGEDKHTLACKFSILIYFCTSLNRAFIKAMRNATHLVDTHQYPVDQSNSHHLLQVLQGCVLIYLLHNEVGDKFGNVPIKKRDSLSVQSGITWNSSRLRGLI